jgi:hypothetical protein
MEPHRVQSCPVYWVMKFHEGVEVEAAFVLGAQRQLHRGSASREPWAKSFELHVSKQEVPLRRKLPATPAEGCAPIHRKKWAGGTPPQPRVSGRNADPLQKLGGRNPTPAPGEWEERWEDADPLQKMGGRNLTPFGALKI